MSKLKPCVICDKEIKPDPDGWAGGHNAEPVKIGQCCGYCNASIVVPARFLEARLVNKVGKNRLN